MCLAIYQYDLTTSQAVKTSCQAAEIKLKNTGLEDPWPWVPSLRAIILMIQNQYGLILLML